MSRPSAVHEAAPALPDDPSDLSRDDWREVAQETLAEIKGDDVPSLAAGVAFKIFLSLFPAVIAAVAIFSYVTTPEDVTDISEAIAGVLPDSTADIVLGAVNDLVQGGGAGVGGLAIGAILAGLWAASSAAATLMRALSRAYDVEEGRSFVRQRVNAVTITLALFVAMIGLMLLLIAGGAIQDALVPEDLGVAVGGLLTLGRFVAALFLVMLLFAVVYWLGPDREQPEWRWLSPGTVIGVVGWLAVSGLFTLYLRVAGNYEATYGALGGVIVLLLWLQLSMMMLLVGAELNAVIDRVSREKVSLVEGSGFAMAMPLVEAVSAAPDPGEGMTLPPVPPPAPGDPLPGLERRDEVARTDGARGIAARVGAAMAAAGAVAVVARRRRRQRRR